MLTQLARVSEARQIERDEGAMTILPQFSQDGSSLTDTVESRLRGIDIALEITPAAPRDEGAKRVATVERMCFRMDAVRKPHEVHTCVTVNGDVLG